MAPGASRLYMHEIIHIVGAGAQGYMEMTKEWAATRPGRGGNRLVGTWASVGATGNWPEVVNLWELTLEDWYGMLDRSYIHREANAHRSANGSPSFAGSGSRWSGRSKVS
ncbi:MAG: hypothetical protein E6J81_16395 [Deltaproteobacteria bacterium]|nr:MAG: hypothetical protein E6J81_16395 [Deltaproteobacteria bacterium]